MTPEQVAHSARGLYDPAHTDPTWVGQYFGDYMPILPRMRTAVDAFFPGTALGISEYDWPNADTVESGLAQAEALGAFAAQSVALACYHPFLLDQPVSYVDAAFGLYGMWDDGPPAYAGEAWDVDVDDRDRLAVHAARADSALHVVIINRADQPTTLRLRGLPHGLDVTECWRLDGASAAPVAFDPCDSSERLTLPARTCWRLLYS